MGSLLSLGLKSSCVYQNLHYKCIMKKILIIDDDESVRDIFSITLKKTGYVVDTVESGEKGVELHKSKKYNLIFLDLKMSGMNGIQTFQKIREFDLDTPIYIITAFEQEFLNEIQNSVKQGCKCDLLHKPISSEEIVLLTTSILG